MKNILVTGAEGMIGKELVELLSKDKNNKIYTADIRTGQDLRYFTTCLTWCCKMDEVYNLAGVKGSPKRTSEQPADFFAPMIQFNTNMLEAARQCGVKKFLYVSSIAVEHPETDEYPAWAKLTGEKQIETYRIQFPEGMKCCIVRPANIYGKYDNFNNPHAMVITSLIAKSQDENNLFIEVWGNGQQERDFVNAKDIAVGMKNCMDKMPQKTINLCSGKGVTIGEVANIIARETKKHLKFDTTKPRGAERRVMEFHGDLINWKPRISIEKGIKEILEKLKNDRSQEK